MGKQNDQRVSQALADIKAELDATAYGSIAQHLTTVEKEYTTVSSFASSNLEDVERYKKELRESQTELENKTTEIEKLTKQIAENDSTETITNLTKERDEAVKELNGFVETQNAEKKNKFIAKYETLKDHANFEKIKGNLKIADTKDDKIDWDSLDHDSINYNLSKFEEYEGLGMFGDVGDVIPPVPGSQFKKEKDPFEDYSS